MLRRIDRIVLRVASLPAAVRYYSTVMGMRLVREEKHFASLTSADASVDLILHDDPDQPAEAVYWLVDDVREMFQNRADLKLTFLGPPTQASRGFRAVIKDPFGLILNIIDRTTESGSTTEDAKAPAGLFPGVEARLEPKRDLLLRLYEQIGRTADDLPYTPHFEGLYEPYAQAHIEPKPTRAETWRHLLNLRKAGKLPKLGEAKSRPPEVSADELARLKDLIGPEIGKRDRLPYTERFDQLVDKYNATLPRRLSPHLIWRLVATMAK